MTTEHNNASNPAPGIPGEEHVTCQAQADHLHHLLHSLRDLMRIPVTSTSARISASIALLRDAIAGRHLAWLNPDSYPKVWKGYWLKLLFYGQQAINALAFTVAKFWDYGTERAKPFLDYAVQHNKVPGGGDAKALREWAMSAYLDLQHVTTFFGEALEIAEQSLLVGLGHDMEIQVVVGRTGAEAVRTPGLEATVALHLPPLPSVPTNERE